MRTEREIRELLDDLVWAFDHVSSPVLATFVAGAGCTLRLVLGEDDSPEVVEMMRSIDYIRGMRAADGMGGD